jgi:hypothetical protein
MNGGQGGRARAAEGVAGAHRVDRPTGKAGTQLVPPGPTATAPPRRASRPRWTFAATSARPAASASAGSDLAIRSSPASISLGVR